MKLHDRTFEIIQAMYRGLPFLDNETGERIYVPDILDRLINAFQMVERLMYKTPTAVSCTKYDSFLLESKNLLLSIPVSDFKVKVKNLDCYGKEILLRNIENVNLKSDDDSLVDYARILT